MNLNLSQRFNLARARYEIKRMNRAELEKACLYQLRHRMLEKNAIKSSLLEQQIVAPMTVIATHGPEFMSEETFTDLLKLNSNDMEEIIPDIDDEGWEDYDEDGLEFA